MVEHEEEREQEVVTGTSAVPTTSEGGTPSSKATGSPPKQSDSPSKGWFIRGLKGFFGPRQPSTPQTRQRSTKATTNASATNTVTITAVFNDKYLLSGDDSDVEDNSPSKLKGFQALFGKSPNTKSGEDRKTRTNDNLCEIASERRENTFDSVSPRRVGLGIAGRAVKDAGCRSGGGGSDGGSWCSIEFGVGRSRR